MRWTVGLSLALVLLAGPAEAQTSKVTGGLIAAYSIGQFTDVTTTAYLMGRGGFKEANPLLKWAEHRPVGMALVKGSVATGVTMLLLKQRRRHPKAVFWTALTLAAVQGVVTWHNAKRVNDGR